MTGVADAGPDRGLRKHIVPVLLFLLCTVVVLWPAIRHFSSRPMIGAGDSSTFYWAWWWGPRQIAAGANPLTTTHIMYPVGADLAVVTTAPAAGFLTWPVRLLFGPDAQVNAAQLLAGFSSALAAYALVLHVWRHVGAATVAGLAFAVTPYRFVHSGEHLNLIFTGVVPLTLLLLLRFLERPSRPRSVAFGLCLGGSALFDPQLALIGGVGVAVVLCARWREVRNLVGGFAMAVVAASVAAAPIVVPLAAALGSGESSSPPAARDLAYYSASPLSWVVPPSTHPLFGDLAGVELLSVSSEGVVYPGLVILALAVAGRAHEIARRRIWVAIGITSFVLSLGPFLTIGLQRLPIPLPFLALRAVPFMDTLRVPGRLALVGVLAVTVLAAGTLADLCRRRPDRQAAILLAVAAVLAIEMLPRWRTTREGGAPAPYEAIADDPGEGAVLEIPLQWSTGTQVIGDASNQTNVALFMAWATVHEKPYVGGAVSRYSDSRLDELYSIDVYRQILGAQREPGFDDPLDFSVDDLADLGIGYLVYHRNVPEPAILDHIESLDMPVLADDGTVIVWKVPGS